MKINWNKYSIFKGESWPWDKHFYTDNLLFTLLTYLKPTGCWPIDYGYYLPKSLHFLIRPLHWSYVVCILLIAGHMAVLFFSTLLIKIKTSDYDALMELGDPVVGSLLFGFSVVIVLYFQVKIRLFKKILHIFNDKFKMRSNIGKFLLSTSGINTKYYRFNRRYYICYNGTQLSYYEMFFTFLVMVVFSRNHRKSYNANV